MSRYFFFTNYVSVVVIVVHVVVLNLIHVVVVNVIVDNEVAFPLHIIVVHVVVVVDDIVVYI